MADKLIKLRITKPVAIEGTPVKPGEIVEVTYEIAMALRRASELYVPDPRSDPERLEHSDPEPEVRDPKNHPRKR